MQLSEKRVLVTGGAGFIGSAFIRMGLQSSLCSKVVNLDALTYAANRDNLASVEGDNRYTFVQGNVLDEALVEELIVRHRIDTLVHFAAESHVDRSIAGPLPFFETNARGTLALLEVLRRCPQVHLHHISTDEVFGSLEQEGIFDETSPYAPSSPYSASKAAADHFIRAYARTYGLSVSLSYCSNNYGLGQHPEKLIPLAIHRALEQKPIPLYGTGGNVRDWLFVEDHAEALWLIVAKRRRDAVYAISAREERSNLEMIRLLLREVAGQVERNEEELLALIEFVADRPGHDWRYALNPGKITRELGWKPRHTLEEGLKKTVSWVIGGVHV